MANFNDIVNLTIKWEGGLSRNPKDTASKNPSPYVYNEKTGWHTNKGITYSTFKAAAKKFGFEDNKTNFINMPQSIWNTIAKYLYWDTLNLDILNSNAIAFQLFSWAWLSGSNWKNRIQKYLKNKGIDWDKSNIKTAEVFNILLKKQSEQQTVKEIEQQQIEFFKNLNQPAFTTGWLNRVKDTTNYALNYVKKKKLGPAVLVAGLFVFFSFYVISKK